MSSAQQVGVLIGEMLVEAGAQRLINPEVDDSAP
jgi:hypothetical protein